MERILYEGSEGGKNCLEEDNKAALCLYEIIAESIWRATGWTCDTGPNAMVQSLTYADAWRRTVLWKNTKAFKMDPVRKTDDYV